MNSLLYLHADWYMNYELRTGVVKLFNVYYGSMGLLLVKLWWAYIDNNEAVI